ncbi:F0F1 ATP synthase subunit delta [Candidatus Nesciobacter abundans]|uniref:ATP synthase subunit delta n=1 Tax=Candidatus Nesciobacter abundans TaxID=2601668 RepID=A0A5C0UFS8_9PROT|nr:F0F1 ATP synthase subunit delta [Candidatus Nesciobacter abundans]QEK38945.1 hypothetical protein FZC36_00640 [Candidatus Nesciobacter abundans]
MKFDYGFLKNLNKSCVDEFAKYVEIIFFLRREKPSIWHKMYKANAEETTLSFSKEFNDFYMLAKNNLSWLKFNDFLNNLYKVCKNSREKKVYKFSVASSSGYEILKDFLLSEFKDINFKINLKPSILGGFIIENNYERIDFSCVSKLKKILQNENSLREAKNECAGISSRSIV